MMLTTPDLSDQNDDAKVIELSFQHYGNIKSFYGQIETAVCPDDNSYVKDCRLQSSQESTFLKCKG